jgi:hypothetical protein
MSTNERKAHQRQALIFGEESIDLDCISQLAPSLPLRIWPIMFFLFIITYFCPGNKKGDHSSFSLFIFLLIYASVLIF